MVVVELKSCCQIIFIVVLGSLEMWPEPCFLGLSMTTILPFDIGKYLTSLTITITRTEARNGCGKPAFTRNIVMLDIPSTFVWFTVTASCVVDGPACNLNKNHQLT